MKPFRAVAILFIIAVIAGTGYLMFSNPDNSINVRNGNNGTNQEQEQEQMEESENMEETSSRNFEYTMPGDWEFTEQAAGGVGALGENQEIAFGIVQNPQNPDISYFATYTDDAEAGNTLLSVYEYNTSDFTWERVYRATYAAGESNIPGLSEPASDTAMPVLRVLGYDSGKLVMLAQYRQDSPGPCAEPLLLDDGGLRSLVSMDLDNPYGGFTEYELPDDVADNLRTQEQECQNNL